MELPWEALKVGLGTQEVVVELDEAALRQPRREEASQAPATAGHP